MAALIAHLENDGATVITAKTLSDILAGTTGTAFKLGVKNVGDRDLGQTANLAAAITQVVGNDGFNRLRIKKDIATISPPWDMAAVLGPPADGGVWGTTGTRGWVVTATNATGETVRSDEVTVNVDNTTKRVTVSWKQVTGATGYKVYRTATPGTYAANNLRATIGSGATISYVDDGSATGAGVPPGSNTTGGAGPNFGTPPADLNTLTAPITPGQVPGTLEIGESSYYWLNRVVPSNSSEAGNPRTAKIAFTET